MGNPYYASGEALRAKHQQTRMDSGRSFPAWALKLVPISTMNRILDAGAGWGRFTWTLVDTYRLAPSRILCLDRSIGMLRTAVQEASVHGCYPHFCAGEIEALPLAAHSFDGVLANHVLYHVRNIEDGARALARCLRPDGWLLATTNSDRVQVLLIDLHHQALTQLGMAIEPEEPSPFSMENGDQYLRTAFRQVERFYFEDEVTYTRAADFVAQYATTGRYLNVIADPEIAASVKQQLLGTYERLVQDIIRQQGILRVPYIMGAFVCRRPID